MWDVCQASSALAVVLGSYWCEGPGVLLDCACEAQPVSGLSSDI